MILKYQHCITRNHSHWWPFLRRAACSVSLKATGICIDPGIYIFPRQIKYSWHLLVTWKLRVLARYYIIEELLFSKCGSDEMQRRKGRDTLQALCHYNSPAIVRFEGDPGFQNHAVHWRYLDTPGHSPGSNGPKETSTFAQKVGRLTLKPAVLTLEVSRMGLVFHLG